MKARGIRIPLKLSLQLSQDCLSTANCYLPTRLLLSIYDFAIVNNDGVSGQSFAIGPSDFGGKSRAWVGKEELSKTMC